MELRDYGSKKQSINGGKSTGLYGGDEDFVFRSREDHKASSLLHDAVMLNEAEFYDSDSGLSSTGFNGCEKSSDEHLPTSSSASSFCERIASCLNLPPSCLSQCLTDESQKAALELFAVLYFSNLDYSMFLSRTSVGHHHH